MPSYKYVAVDEAGAKQTGKVEAVSAVAAQNELLAHDLRVTKLKEDKGVLNYEITRKKIKPDDVMNFSRQLASFLHAGVSILDALDALSEDCDSPILQQVIIDIGDSLRGGSGFAEAVAQHRELFPTYYIGVLRSAELTGNLDIVLDQLANYIERDQTIRKAIRSAMTYPLVVIGMAAVTILVLVAYVLPKFEGFFKEFNAKLPITTRILLDGSRFLGDVWPLLLVAVVVLTMATILYFRSDPGRLVRDKMMLKMPVVGDIALYGIVERFCRILGTMLSAGVPVPEAIASSTEATDNLVFERTLANARDEVLRGEGIARPMQETGLFPRAAIQMIKVGEQSGSLDHQLGVAATYYEGELSQKLKRLTNLIEPTIMIIIGLIVGFVAIALVSAMYGIFNQVKLK